MRVSHTGKLLVMSLFIFFSITPKYRLDASQTGYGTLSAAQPVCGLEAPRNKISFSACSTVLVLVTLSEFSI
jgi:hypothetical protein